MKLDILPPDQELGSSLAFKRPAASWPLRISSPSFFFFTCSFLSAARREPSSGGRLLTRTKLVCIVQMPRPGGLFLFRGPVISISDTVSVMSEEVLIYSRDLMRTISNVLFVANTGCSSYSCAGVALVKAHEHVG